MKTIVLWGNSGVGKTTLLSTYLEYEVHRKRWMGDIHDNDNFASIRQLKKHLLPLRKHSHVLGTAATTTYKFVSNASQELNFMDFKGDKTSIHTLPDEEREAIKNSSGVMFIVQYSDLLERTKAYTSIRDGLALFSEDVPHALIINKADEYLLKNSPDWHQDFDWASRFVYWKDVLDRFHETTFLTTAFGYCLGNFTADTYSQTSSVMLNYPACILSEFGDILPFWKNRDDEFVYQKIATAFDSVMGQVLPSGGAGSY